MLDIIKIKNHDKKNLRYDFYQRFLIADKISDLKKLKVGIELCIIQTDFGKADLKLIKKAREINENTEFWICSKQMTKENILIANGLGIKTVISSPIDYKMVEDFFNKKNNLHINQDQSKEYDISSIANSKVMIVDDNIMNVELLEETLSSLELNITSFVKPKEAQKVILQKKFDLFLLDVMMPDMSGFELALEIKESPLNQNVPIVFISALSDSNNKLQGYDLGSFAYIEKPFDINIIKSQIFNILKTQKMYESLARTKDSFYATVTHDLKTPISAGINALNMLRNETLGELEDDQLEIIEDLLHSTKFMQDMVENILCKNKVENNKIMLSKQVFSLKKVVEHCIELTKYILAPKNQQIVFRSDIGEALLPLDFLEMKRAIHNLIANASDYSPRGSKIIIEIFEVENSIAFSIQDFGNGIDLSLQNDVFSQYMSFAKKYKKVGSGLGLYITKSIVEAHGGKINLTSRIGYGTKITFYLPMYCKE